MGFLEQGRGLPQGYSAQGIQILHSQGDKTLQTLCPDSGLALTPATWPQPCQKKPL